MDKTRVEKRSKITLMWKIWLSMVFGGFFLGAFFSLLMYLQKSPEIGISNLSLLLLLPPIIGFFIGFGFYIFIKTFTRFLTQKLISKSESLLKQKISVLPSVFKSSEIDEMESITGMIIKNLETYRDNLISAEKEKEKVKRLFGYYISPKIVDKIVESGEAIITTGETADIAVMFIDLKGFHDLSKRIPNREIITFINEYFSQLGNIIEKKDGFIDKYIDQEVMLLFGAPLKHVDDERRATEAAVEIKKMFYMNIDNWKPRFQIDTPLDIVIGINKGEVVMGNIGSKHKLNYTSIGDNVNFASRLCSIARPGEILLSESIYHVLQKYPIDYKLIEKEPIQVKGKTGTYKIFSIE